MNTDPVSYRYSDYVREIKAEEISVNANDILLKAQFDENGKLLPVEEPVVRLRAKEIAKLLQPYVSSRFMEQVRSVIPLALYLVVFQVLILRQLVEDSWLVTSGIFAVIVGLMLFMEGLKIGLMPFGTIIGENLPRKLSLPPVLLITLLLGIGVTFAEPAIGALKMAGQLVFCRTGALPLCPAQ